MCKQDVSRSVHPDIRCAEKEDLEHICQIEEASFSSSWSREQIADSIGGRYEKVLVCCMKGTVTGYIMYSMVCDEAELLRVAVLPEYRGGGYAGCLLEKMLDDCRHNNIRSVFLEVREGNAAARRLYDENGFVQISIRKNYYSNPAEHAIVMEKSL